MESYHVPVLFAESIDLLNIRSGGVYVDLTFGGGGHSRGILERLSVKGRLLGFDQDSDARRNVPDDARFTFIESNFRFMRGQLRLHGYEQVDGVLLLLNTVGGDIEAGLAIAELAAGMTKPVVTLVLGGGHSIGVPLAVCGKETFIAPTASMTVHPVRMSGTVIAAPETYRYFERLQERIIQFVAANSRVTAERFRELMLSSGDMANDVGTVLYGEQAVAEGIIDRIGTLGDALEALYGQIERRHG